MPVTLQSQYGIERYTTKEDVSYYSGVPVEDIEDTPIRDAEDWVESELRKKAVEPQNLALPDSNLRQAATYYAVYLLSKAGGGKKYKINPTLHTSSQVGEIAESLSSPMFTQEEKPTTDWYGMAQREMDSFFKNMLDAHRVSLNKWKAAAGSTTDVAPRPFLTTGLEEYSHSQRLRQSSKQTRKRLYDI